MVTNRGCHIGGRSTASVSETVRDSARDRPVLRPILKEWHIYLHYSNTIYCFSTIFYSTVNDDPSEIAFSVSCHYFSH